MSFIAVAIGGAAVVAAGATAFAASSASSSASAANATNAANVSNTNQLNYNEFLQSRGSDGSAIYPIYAAPAEAQLYSDTLGTYDATGAIAPTAAQYQAVVNGAQAGAAGATTAANNIFNGNTLNTELNQQAPVSAATLAVAQTQKQSSLEALQQTLNNIKSIQAGKGYSGDSFGNQLLNFQARQSANTTGAGAIANANLTNAKSVQGIQENATNREIQNLNAPTTAASQQANLLSLPTNALAQNQVTRQNLFSNFKIGTQAFQYQNLPLVNPTASTGQIAGQAAGSLASSVGGAVANQSLVNALTQPNYTNPPQPTVDQNNSEYAGEGDGAPVGESIAAEEDIPT